jgi:hypothetical protein
MCWSLRGGRGKQYSQKPLKIERKKEYSMAEQAFVAFIPDMLARHLKKKKKNLSCFL